MSERKNFYDATLRICNVIDCNEFGKGCESIVIHNAEFIGSFCDAHRKEATKVFDNLREQKLNIEIQYHRSMNDLRNKMNKDILSIGQEK